MQKNDVVVTGIGVISPIGIGKTAYSDGLKNGKLGIKPISLFDCSNFPIKFAGEIADFDPLKFLSAKHARRVFRFAQFGIAASRLAIVEAQLDLTKTHKGRVGISFGTSIGALPYPDQMPEYFDEGIDSIHPFFASYVIPSSCATEVSIEFKIDGPIYTNVNACAASTSAIGIAFHTIRDGRADVMLAGGAEAPISPITLGSLKASRILSQEQSTVERAYRPYTKDRSGIVIGEGAAVMVLESLDHAIRRGAPILAEITGYFSNSDAFHILLQPPDGSNAVRAIHGALEDAGIGPGDIGYVNSHGSGTIMNDKTETVVLKGVFGDSAYKVPISTTKSMIGHAMGACGALEMAACVIMLENKFLHPTINLCNPDPECDLDYIPNNARYQSVDYILKLSSGFGGYNSVCILKRFVG